VFDFLDGYDVLGAFWMTVKLTAVSAVGALVWGTLLAAMRVSPVPLMRGFGTAYVNIVRNIPLTVIIVFNSLGLADIFGVTLGASDFKIQGFRLAVLGFIAYTSAFVCEALRSGVNAVPLGQAEAGRAIGLTFGQSMREIVLPQATRAVIPPMTSVLIALLKNTSVAAAFGMAEATATMRALTNDNADQRIGIFLAFAIGYIVLVEVVSLSSYVVERKVKVAR